MNYYYKKRANTGLSRSDVATALGIDYKKYSEIERGERKMPSKLMDKFNEIIKKSKGEMQIEHLTKEQEVDNWIEEIKQKEDGELKLNKKMKEFNISSYNELGKLIGYSNGTGISALINNTRPVSYDLKNALYSFFQNELNIKPVKARPKSTKFYNIERSKSKELIKFYKNFDLKKWMKDNGYEGVTQLANAMQISATTLYYYIKPKNSKTISYESTINKVKQFVENNNKKEETIEKPKENDTINNKFAEEICRRKFLLIQQISELEKQITELQNKAEIMEEMIKLANEIGE